MSADRSAGTVAAALVATTTVQALVTMAVLAMSVVAPQAARDVGVGPENIGLYAALVYGGAMVGTLTAGGFILRYGAIRFSQVAVAACAVGLAVGSGPHWLPVALSALVCGIGYGPTTPASSHVLARHTPPRFLSVVFSVKQTGVPLGGLLAGLFVPPCLVLFGWQGALWAVAAMIALCAAGLEPTRRRFDQDLQPAAPLVRGNVAEPLKLALARRELRLLVLGSFLFAGTQQTYVYFLVTYLETGIGWSNRDAGLALSVLGAAGIAGRVLWGGVADATGRSGAVLALLGFGMAASAAATAAATAAWPGWVVLVACAAFGATGVAWNGVYLAEISRRVAPEEVGKATGGGLFVTFAGVVTMPPLFGLAAQLTGSFAFGYHALAAATAAVGLLLLLPGRRGVGPPPVAPSGRG